MPRLKNPFNSRIKTIVLSIVFLIALFSAGYFFLNNNDKAKLNTTETVSSLYKEAVDDPSSCEGGLNQLSNTANEVNNENLKTFQYQKYCQLSLRDYKGALATMEKLKVYYQRTDDKEAISILNEDIADAKTNLEHPVPNGPLKQTLGPEEQKAFKE